VSDAADAAIISAPPAPLSAAELPEVTWLWRRFYTYALTLLLCALVGFVIHQLAIDARVAAAALERLGYGLLVLIALLILFYLGGATLTDIMRLVAIGKDRVALRASPGGPP
jgi:hypothetical protein